MKQRELTATVRTERGKNACRRLRRQGIIPAVAYGRGMEPIAIQVNAREMRAALGTHAEGHLVNLRLKRNGSEETLMTLVKEVQRDPVTGAPLSMDFQRISLTEKITTSVPLVAHGTPAGAHAGGILEQAVHEVAISCLPTDLPEEITFDVSHLNINDSVHLRDLQPPAGVEILGDADTVVAIVHPPRVAEEPTPIAEEPTEPEVIQTKGKKEEVEEEQ
ncbi:MAG: 50S ribosomal protein L25 [Abditibacteriales bacterium]|nr:50S ribosomal protein L25 [Abditibacteriales bacterium]MDW8365719.1 50S ribosomal protein L25 [Abditibacteriales bacterium]